MFQIRCFLSDIIIRSYFTFITANDNVMKNPPRCSAVVRIDKESCYLFYRKTFKLFFKAICFIQWYELTT